MGVFTQCFELKMNGIVAPSSGGSKNFCFVFHYRLQSGTPQTPASIITAFDAHPGADIAALLSNDWSGTTYDCRYMSPATNQYYSVASTQVGGKTGDRLPMDMAVAMLLRSDERGRNYRGGKHFGPIIEADTLKDELTAGALTAWKAVATLLENNLTVLTSSYKPVVLSQTLSQTRIDPVVTAGADIQNVLVNKNLGTMRRRREKTVR